MPHDQCPRKAVLLAAGFGSRMAPLSHDLPKPMMPLWGLPVLEHILQTLAAWGIREVLINLHHQPQPIMDWCLQRRSASPRLQFSFEPEILGTGGALKRAAHFLGKTPFWLINTDIAFELDPAPLIHDFQRHRPLASLWMHASAGPRTVEIHPDGRIENFVSSHPGTPGTYTFCGLQILTPAILDLLPDQPFCSVVDGYRRALKTGKATVRGVTLSNAFWADLGTPERYLAAHRDILEANRHRQPGGGLLLDSEKTRMRQTVPHGVRGKGFVAIGRHVQISTQANLADCVLWDHARLPPAACVADSIVGTAADVRGLLNDSTLVRLDRLPPDPVLAAVRRRLQANPGRTTLATLPARGSDRTFERFDTGKRRAILIRYDDTKRTENGRYAEHARWLAGHGLQVPGVLLELPAHKAVLFEDVGQHALQDLLPAIDRRARRAAYRRVLDQLLILHAIPLNKTPPCEPPFSAALYRWEHELFACHFLGKTLGLTTREQDSVLTELGGLSAILLALPPVLVHRDFQSSNIIMRGRRPFIIDFQGIRTGAAAYDLASLLCDPYVMLDKADRTHLLAYYCKRSPQGAAAQQGFAAAAVQRLSQALGAYGRLAAKPATRRFSRYLAPACRMLTGMLDELPAKLHHIEAACLRYHEPPPASSEICRL